MSSSTESHHRKLESSAVLQIGLSLPGCVVNFVLFDWSSVLVVLQNYLVKFGYLQPAVLQPYSHTSHSNKEAMVKVAITNFQKYYGLPPTGMIKYMFISNNWNALCCWLTLKCETVFVQHSLSVCDNWDQWNHHIHWDHEYQYPVCM
jgi:hypothetical protein